MRFRLNGAERDVPAEWADEPLLWLLRDHFGLNGARFGCGAGLCGACAVHVDGAVQRACQIRSGDVAGAEVVTLDGLGAGWPDGLHPVQAAWIAASVPQCGYCQNGQVMTVAALHAAGSLADRQAVAGALDGVLCRCGTHGRIAIAVAALAEAKS